MHYDEPPDSQHFNRIYMTTGTLFLLIAKVVGDNAVYDGGHGAFFLGGHPFKLLQFVIGYKAYDPIWACDTGGGLWSAPLRSAYN
jgi:hypothetical protein